MKKLDFSKKYDRRGTDSVKWDHKDFVDARASDTALPLWLSDMEFPVADEIVEALNKRVSHGFFGQSMPSEKYYDAVKSYHKRRFNWDIDTESIFYAPGVLPAIGFAIREFTNEGEGIIIQPPVFYPFQEMIEGNRRVVINNNLINNEEIYTINFEDLEEKLKNPNNTMMILCSPHNPVGRVWSKEELQRVVELCKKYDVIILSDEIHNGITRKSVTHYPLQSVTDYPKIITTVAPSKTFNVGGLPISQVIIRDQLLRDKWDKQTRGRHYIRFAPPIDMIMAEIAYTKCDYWVDQILEHVEDNFDFLVDFMNKNLPDAKYKKPEGTFLAWVNFGAYVDHKELMDILIEKYDLLIEDGDVFGEPGIGYFRISIACPRDDLKEGMNRILHAIEELLQRK